MSLCAPLCACTACMHTPSNLYTYMSCAPLISIEMKGINQDFRYEIRKICTHLRVGSDITEQLWATVQSYLGFCAYALNHIRFYHYSFLSPPPPSVTELVLQKNEKVDKDTALLHSSASGFVVWTYLEREQSAVVCSRCSEEVLAYKQETVRTVDVTASREVEVHPTSSPLPYSSKEYTECKLRMQFSNC